MGQYTQEQVGPNWLVQVLLRITFITLLGSAIGIAVIRFLLGKRVVTDDTLSLSYVKDSEDPATYFARLWNARRRCVRMLCVTAASAARYPNSDRPKAALAALVRLASPNSKGSNYLVYICGGMEAAMVMMAVNRSNAQVLTNVCTLLHELASAPPTVVKVRHTPNVANGKIPLAVLTVMRLFPSEPRVVEAAAAALWSFAFGSGAFIQNTLVGAEAYLDLMAAIVRFPDDIPVLYRCCGAIMALALRNAETQKIMGEAGAAHLLMETLTNHRELNYGGACLCMPQGPLPCAQCHLGLRRMRNVSDPTGSLSAPFGRAPTPWYASALLVFPSFPGDRCFFPQGSTPFPILILGSVGCYC